MTTEDLQRIGSLPLPWNKLEDKNILITGATGLIGSALVTALLLNPQKNYNVYAAGRSLDRLQRRFFGLSCESLHLLEYDFANPLNLDIPFHYIIDCASNANPAAFKNQPVEVIMGNIMGVSNMLQYGLKNRMERFLFVSTGEVYGEGDGRSFNENYSGYVDILNSRACYPTSKRAAENLCIAYMNEYGADVVIARPCHTFGPYFQPTDDRAYAQFLRNAIAGENIVLKSTGQIKRSWCYVADCVSALMYILLKGKTGQAYNIASPGNILTIRDFARTIATIAGTEITFDVPENAPKAIITQGILDSSLIQQLGWQPELTFTEQVQSTIEELRQ